MASSKREKAQNDAPAKGAQALVYVGPNMGGDLPMQQFTVFRGGLPVPVKARVDQDQDFADLFVPVAELSAARAALERAGTELKRAFGTVWAAYAAKRKEGK